ncbi:GDSL esterase/lipase At4g10955-like [Corylus avellana]|uniref:GDSL esterase/lipase At4g10955-like n=1 Tax=Corylus avellana TaxID=13451 RepID=UPI001E21E0A1|nr:GDSL esterase/lipase At4g10955-like [Corylus avellana]
MDNNHIFSHSGPENLTTVDWTNPHRRRCFIASLVEGVYRLEHDRLGNRHRRHGPDQAHLAPPPWRWWDFFHEPQAHRVLTNPDGSIFGAIYEYKYPPSFPNPNIPRYVIAFRGVMRKLPTILPELLSVVRCMLNELKRSSRFHRAMDAVQRMVDIAGAGNVWLAGHSLGSALALLVGKKMVMEKGVLLETYLFNPPFIGLPIELIIKDEKLKRVVRTGFAFGKAGLARVVGGHRQHSHEAFAELSDWSPHLFVNQGDPICAEYIGYFGNRKFMKQIGAENIENTAGMSSITSLVSSAVAGGDSEASHLLPSAFLTVNKGSTPDNFEGAHAIDQWWDPNCRCEPVLYNKYQNHIHPMAPYLPNNFIDTQCMPYQNHLHPTVQDWPNNFTNPPGMLYQNCLSVQYWPNNFTNPPGMLYQYQPPY